MPNKIVNQIESSLSSFDLREKILYPHNFSSLCKQEDQPALFVGTGLSFGVIPDAWNLFDSKKEDVEQELGCLLTPEERGNDLYAWSEKLLATMPSTSGLPKKLLLAKALGLTTDPAWGADVNFPLRGTAPKHRVIARFARDKVWKTLWCWNWDCLIENALERVGFVRGEGAKTQPWMTNFSSIVVNEDIRNSDRPDKFSIFKPHGCVQSMICAEEAAESGDLNLARKISDRFMIGAQELSQIRENQTDRQFATRLQNSLYTSPAVIVGWSVSEPYLKQLVNDAMAQQVNKKKVQELSVVDINFGAGHQKVADTYELSKDDVFFEVGKNIGVDDANQFFLWLQAKFTLEHLAEYAPSPAITSIIGQYNDIIELDNISLLNWADTFLPAWCLLCWRGDVVPCAGFRPDELDIDKPDNYIPISHPVGIVRHDLSVAAEFLASIDDLEKWDLEKYPGCLWDEGCRKLIIPLPSWGNFNALAAIPPMVSGLNISIVEELSILPLSSEGIHQKISEQVLTNLKLAISHNVMSSSFAQIENISIATDVLAEER